MQQAICPLCGGMIPLEAEARKGITCPHCQGQLDAVMNGLAVILMAAKKPEKQEPAEVVEGLRRAEEVRDPAKRYPLYQKLLAEYPDSLAVNAALLRHGRLHERSSRQVDFTVIKSYLLHMFEEPERHPEEEQQAYVQELFAHPQLLRCLELSADPATFYQQYLEWISRQYISLFLKGSSRHMRTVFGFSMGKTEKLLAEPAAMMIRCMRTHPLLTPQQRQELSQAFYQAFRQEVGDAAYLDERLNGTPV